jgi:hypothetical protein
VLVAVLPGGRRFSFQNIAVWYAGGKWPCPRRINHGWDYFFFFFAAFFVAKSLTPLRTVKLDSLSDRLHSLNQHIVQGFERIGTDFSKAFVTLERRRNRRERRFPFNLQPAFD